MGWKHYKCPNCEYRSGNSKGNPNTEHNCKDFEEKENEKENYKEELFML